MNGEQENYRELAAAQQAAEAFTRSELTVDYDTEVPESEVPPRELAEQPTTVVTSLRIPLDLYQRIKAVAESRGTTMGALLREWAELELTALENDQPISRADALRALASLRPLGSDHAA